MSTTSLNPLFKTLDRYLCIGLLLTVGCLSLYAQESIDDDNFSFSDLPIDYYGYVSTRHGLRFQEDPFFSKRTVLNETRLRLGMDIWLDWGEIKLKNDFIYDYHQEKYVNDLRLANVLLTPWEKLDIKIGRQILTWGKGDMLFVNDLFPKDWQAFFIGRELEFLKGTSDAIKFSFYFPWFDVDAIYIPKFNSDKHPDATYLSYYNPFQAAFVGDGNPDKYDSPNDWFGDDEFHLRMRKTIGNVDLAIYGYHGYWKSPAGFAPSQGIFNFPQLAEVGLSMESSIAGGIASLEYGYYRSLDDIGGNNPLIRNSQTVFLIGYSYDFKNDLKIGIQYFAEVMHKYDALKSTLPTGVLAPNRYHDFMTWRLTKLLDKQRLELSSFVYYSITDTDIYWRVNTSYKVNDKLKIDLGMNYFNGKDDVTFWSQFENNNNAYIGIKRSL